MSENGCIVRSENGYGFLRPGLKTGVENGIFWSEIGSGFGYAGSTPQTNSKAYSPGSHWFKLRTQKRMSE